MTLSKTLYPVNFNVFKTALLFACSTLLIACSFNNDPINRIKITQQGKNIESRPLMSEVCKGFFISPTKLIEFYNNAAITHEEQANNNYLKLPCYSSGIAYFGDEKFQWIIRAGGVGEFYNETKSFTKICGVSCCDKVQGVC
ncbi:hypothetical protein [Psychromonas sp.]|uniref:hypothetical protein n=1 Tax=Psychromonas sp. TaxID=1884585 RepID=UPI0039E23AB8